LIFTFAEKFNPERYKKNLLSDLAMSVGLNIGPSTAPNQVKGALKVNPELSTEPSARDQAEGSRRRIDPFDGAQAPPFRTGRKAPLRVNPEQAPAFRPGS